MFIWLTRHAGVSDVVVLVREDIPGDKRLVAYGVSAGDSPPAIDDLRTRLLEEPIVYMLFPEGTRTRTGAIGRFKPGVGMLVAGTDIPVDSVLFGVGKPVFLPLEGETAVLHPIGIRHHQEARARQV